MFKSVVFWVLCEINKIFILWFCGRVSVCDCEAVNLSESALGRAADPINHKYSMKNTHRLLVLRRLQSLAGNKTENTTIRESEAAS